MTVRYRKISTGQVNTYSRVMPRLDASRDWERVVDEPPAPPPVVPWSTSDDAQDDPESD